MANKTKITVLFFAKSRELTGTKETTIELNSEISARDILQSIIAQFQSLEILSDSLVLSLNEEYIPLDDSQTLTLHSGDIIAVIPPISGTTRDNFQGKKVKLLEYEAYEPMAKKEIYKICNEIREKWKVENIAIVHRIGVVPVTESSVAIVVSSAHRKEALEAVQYGIDTLKATVPIWKKEIYEDDSSTWKENSECCNKKQTV